MPLRKRKARASEPEPPKVDEREWDDWRRLREELGQRLGTRDAMGETDPELLEAARRRRKP